MSRSQEDTALKAETLPVQWRLPPYEDDEPAGAERALRERIKELNCLYAIAQLAERYDSSFAEFLGEVVHVLPPSWQYPEITCARIVFEGRRYASADFEESPWRQSAPIRVYGEKAGEVAVFYRSECPELYEGPFLREERALLDDIAERIGTVAMRMAAERDLRESNQQLTVERQALRDANTALRAVLSRIEEEKREIRREVQSNVEKVVMPILYELSLAVQGEKRQYVELLRDSLNNITSPFVDQLSRKYAALTPTEIQICSMIRNGLRTKDIAKVRGISAATVSRHRESIRRKLELTNQHINLTTYLQSTMSRDSV